MDHGETLEFVLDNSADIIMLMAADGTTEYTTPSIERVLGWRRDEFRNRSALEIIHPEDRARVQGALTGTFDSTSALRPYRFRAQRAEGGWLWMEVRATHPEDRHDVVIISARDVNDEVLAATEVAEQIAQRQAAEARLNHINLHDPVTGLPNRNLLADRIDQAIRRAHRSGIRSALLLCDLDRFKVINDALGHTVGDQLLNIVAKRLRMSVRETDTVARFGGDEFVILSEELSGEDDPVLLATRFHAILAEPIELAGHTVHVSVSTGIVVIEGHEARDEVVSNADAAMYAAKAAGRNCWTVFDPALREQASDRLRIEAELREALHTGTGLSVHLQPEVALDSRATVGFEALLRWTAPDGTPVAPDRFLPIAADAGLMPLLGRRVAISVAQCLADLRQARNRSWVAMNAAVEELQHPDFVYQVLAAVETVGVSPNRLCIEITEHSIMNDPAGVEAALRPLRELGATVAIDDFGTGYSSLAYLTRFRPEFLKIDRSFTAAVTERDSERAVVEAVMHLADSLAVTTVAEGIETEEQARVLTELGCQLGQGWLFGRPAPIQQILAA